MDFERVDMDDITEDELKEAFRMNELLFKLNHTMRVILCVASVTKGNVITVCPYCSVCQPFILPYR